MYTKLIFIVSSLSQPRAIRRVESIAKLGYDVEVYGYDRGQYNCNKFSDNIPTTVMGKMTKGNGYWKKLRTICKDVSSIIDKHKGQCCLYYSFGFFETLFLRLNKVPYAYEISDIVYANKGIFGKILHRIDRFLIKDATFTLLTSEGFKIYLNQPKAKYIIQPNKVNNKIYNVERKPLHLKINDKIIFSFVGSIRYETMMRFLNVIGKYFPQHEFHLHGVANIPQTKENLDGLIKKYTNIKLFGEFKNPDDFERIYNSVHVIVTTYGNETLNERILDPNKLYEGMLFCRPIIASEGTFLAEQVKRYNCGFCIDSSSEESIKSAMESISVEEYNLCSSREFNIDRKCLLDDMTNMANLLAAICHKK